MECEIEKAQKKGMPNNQHTLLGKKEAMDYFFLFGTYLAFN